MVVETEDPTQGTPEEEPAELEEQVELIEEPEAAPEPSPEYKGLQRKHQRTQDELAVVRGELAQLRQQQTLGQQQMGVDPLAYQAQNLATPVYHQSIQEGMTEQQAQRAFGLAYQAAYANLGYQQVKEQAARDRADRESQATVRELEQEMREMAQEVGVDPDDPELDYGDTRSPDAVAKMRSFRASLREVKARVDRQAPAAARKPPDRSAARIERTEPTGTVGKPDAEAKKRAFEKLNADINSGAIKPTKFTYAELKRLRDEAIAAGAVF